LFSTQGIKQTTIELPAGPCALFPPALIHLFEIVSMSTDKLSPVRALVVDDDSDIREFVGSLLESAGCEVRVVADGERALIETIEFQPEIVFLDIKIPEQDGWLVCAKIKLVEPSPTVVLMTGHSDDNLDSFSEFVKADNVLRKPFSAGDVLGFIPVVLT
jgi:DNA-binding response OmpR family regulator